MMITSGLILTQTQTAGIMTAVPATISLTATVKMEKSFTPTPTRPLIITTKASEPAQKSPTPMSQPLTITIIYDNNPYDNRLSTAWGFSALVEYREHILLFDTGGDGQLLLGNMRILGIDPKRIESVVLSHAHEDHTGGLITLLNTGVKPVVYLLPSFPVSFKHHIQQFTKVIDVSPGQSLGEGLWTTGEMGSAIPEQALVIQTEAGLVIITGCAHPGIVEMVEQAQNMLVRPVRLVLGGFHLGSKGKAEIEEIIKDFRYMGVEQVAPCHCTGENAMTMFAVEYGEDFFQVGVGSTIRLEAEGR
jgi:7,8-dihydropterin-6-yl-methyl-4-(beta-D-ribofuranosyl)aminobenzene 5'-phosphate synthase